MLYKVTPAMLPGARKSLTPVSGAPRPRRRRASAIYDGDGNEVLITLMCLKCRHMRPLAQFGLRKMPDGAVRNQPWCRSCRGSATPKRRSGEAVGPADALATDAVPQTDTPTE